MLSLSSGSQRGPSSFSCKKHREQDPEVGAGTHFNETSEVIAALLWASAPMRFPNKHRGTEQSV